MIDTDKYEGHTPAPWKWIIDDKDTYLSCFDNDIKADENLIADAPLLLQEVKRLREENDMLSEAVKEDNDILKKHIETLEKVKRLRELLESVVENATEPSGDDGTDYRYCEVDAELVEMIEEEMNRLVKE